MEIIVTRIFFSSFSCIFVTDLFRFYFQGFDNFLCLVGEEDGPDDFLVSFLSVSMPVEGESDTGVERARLQKVEREGANVRSETKSKEGRAVDRIVGLQKKRIGWSKKVLVLHVIVK